MKFDTVVLQVNVHRLMDLDFRSDVTLSRWWLWIILCRKVLPSNECTWSICPEHMQQHPWYILSIGHS